MYSQETVLGLIDRIYAAAGDAAEWATLLKRLGELFKGSVGSLHSQHANSQSASVAASWNIDESKIRQYVEHYSSLNPCFVLGKAQIQQGAVKLREAFCADDVMLASEFYNDYLRHIRAFGGVVATVFKNGNVSANLTIFRPKAAKPFGEQERALVQVLMPHLQRAFRLHHRIQGFERKADAAAAALDRLQQGIVLLNSKGNVLLVNRAAAAVFTAEKTLKLTPRGLAAMLPAENRQLNAFIAGAIDTGNGKGSHSGGAMTISRDGLRARLQVLVTPLKTRTIHLGQDVPVAAIFISDPDRKPASDGAVLSQLFGLTPAESRLAEILTTGETLRDAAEKLGVAQSTVRSQLKAIFGKTNTNRQSQLVRILAATQIGR